MNRVPLRRAQALLAAMFGGGLAIQIALLTAAFASNEIYLDNFKEGLRALGKLYSPPLGIIIAALMADPSSKTRRVVQNASLWAALVTCGAWNLLLLALGIGFALGTDTIESFLPIFTEVGVDTSWLTTGALAYFFVKSASGTEASTK